MLAVRFFAAQTLLLPAAKDRSPPLVTVSANGPKLPFATISIAAMRCAKADIGALPQHY
jgi:hypothetical protein